jgi:hypothetical protein
MTLVILFKLKSFIVEVITNIKRKNTPLLQFVLNI